MHWQRRLVLAAAALLIAADVAALGVHDFDDADRGTTASTPGATTSTLPGKLFEGRKDQYTLQVDPGWPHRSNTPIEGMERWEVAATTGGGTPNMGVLVENLPTNISIDDYLRASTANLPNFMSGAKVTSTRVVKGVFDQSLGFIEYEATIQGVSLRFLAVASVRGRRAVVATFAAGAADFAQIRAAVEPYLLTLQAK